MQKSWFVLFAVLFLTACNEKEVATGDSEKPIRGIKTFLVQDIERATVRRFPSVLQPATVSSLSFEVAGKLRELTLKVGQVVKKDDIIAEIDPTTLELRVQTNQAALKQAQATAKNAAENLARKEKLLTSGTVTNSSVDDARTNAITTAAQATQAEKNLATAREDLSKTTLRAPFNGIVNTLNGESFATVAAGAPIATMYATDAFEVSFSVNYEIASQLTVGKPALVRLADNPSIVLKAVVSELSSRANTVSSFPVVITVTDTNAAIKAGMAVEISLEFKVATGQGYALPASAAIKQGQIQKRNKLTDPAPLGVYVFDPDSSTVKKRLVMIAGVRENSLLVVEGLKT
ncbi:MAG: efflux RND transporter periplasmic adaptor subunit, partial [Hyphomicrobiales bacterium]|nr:efflux RND transporter periplasmic adaptor subunit [Hyphomicrobiales bacterium]